MAQMLQVNFTLEHLDLGETDQVIHLKDFYSQQVFNNQ